MPDSNNEAKSDSAFEVKLLKGCSSVLPVIAQWIDNQWGERFPSDKMEPSLERLKSTLNSDRIPLTIVGFAEGKPVATACLQESMLTLKRPFGPWVAYVYVPPEFRGRKFGAKIVGALESEAQRIGLKEIYLSTASEELPFYAKLGWENIEEFPGMNGAVMKKSLTG